MFNLLKSMNAVFITPTKQEPTDSHVKANTSSPLLNLPTELRDQIWSLAFKNQNVSGPCDTSFHHFLEDCEPCYSFSTQHREQPSTAISLYKSAWRPLLTCKQIYHEAAETLYDTTTMHILTYVELLTASKCSISAREKITRLALYIHATDENRHEWMVLLGGLYRIFPRLRQLTVHKHMRPPISHDNLVDAVYIAGPLTTLPASVDQKFVFAYLKDETMFQEVWIGRVRASDAIEEHEMVIRDTMADAGFRRASAVRDLDAMTGRLLDIAHSYQQTWLEKLYQRRIRELIEDGMTQAEAETAHLTAHS